MDEIRSNKFVCLLIGEGISIEKYPFRKIIVKYLQFKTKLEVAKTSPEYFGFELSSFAAIIKLKK